MTHAVEINSSTSHVSPTHSRRLLEGTVPSLMAVLTLVLLLLVAGVATNCIAQTPTLTPEAVRDLRLQPGVVLILIDLHLKSPYVNNGKPVPCQFSGSGFLYRPDGYLITNGHVVEAANVHDFFSLLKLIADPNLKQQCVGKLEPSDWTDQQRKVFIESVSFPALPSITVFLDNGQSFSGEIKQYSGPIEDGGKDVAILKIDALNLPTVPLGKSSGINVGDPITVIGYPGAAAVGTDRESALIPTVTNGKVSALKGNINHARVIQSEVNINHGNSGGPAFNEQGRAIGIATYGSSEAGGFNFFVPIDTALEFVNSSGAQPESGSFDAIWSEALDAYAKHNWNQAHAQLSRVLEMMPNQPDAEKLMKEAATREAQEGNFEKLIESVRTTNPVIWIGSALVVTALAAGGFILLIYKPKTPTASGYSRPASSLERPTTVDRPVALGSLQVTNGPNKGKEYAIPKTGLQIGRDPQSCTIVLPADNVGREHAWVMPMENGEVAVIDRGSANHTYVNSFEAGPIKKVLLKNGDRIFICRENSTEIVYYRG